MGETSIDGTNLADIIALRGVGGPYGGYGGYGPYQGRYANTSTIQHGIHNVGQKVEDANDCNRAIFGQSINAINQNLEGLQRDNQFAATNRTLLDNFQRVCDRLNTDSIRNSDMIFQQELRQSDRLRDLDSRLSDVRAENKDCCCKLEAKMEALSKEGILRDLNRAERQLQTQTILSTCGCGCGGGVRPCPPHPPQ